MAFTGHRQALSQEALEEMLMNKEDRWMPGWLCGKLLRKAAFSKTQWRTYPNRPRCNVCTNSDRAFSAAVKKLPPLPATVAVSVSTSASSATVSVSVAP